MVGSSFLHTLIAPALLAVTLPNGRVLRLETTLCVSQCPVPLFFREHKWIRLGSNLPSSRVLIAEKKVLITRPINAAVGVRMITEHLSPRVYTPCQGFKLIITITRAKLQLLLYTYRHERERYIFNLFFTFKIFWQFHFV